jgi:hypothetical protein
MRMRKPVFLTLFMLKREYATIRSNEKEATMEYFMINMGVNIKEQIKGITTGINNQEVKRKDSFFTDLNGYLIPT